MANDVIFSPCDNSTESNTTENTDTSKYLEKEKYLSEYTTETEKSLVRENIGASSKDSVYTKDETDTKISEKIRNIIQEHLNADDPHGTIPTVEQMIADMVKTDGSTPFVQP